MTKEKKWAFYCDTCGEKITDDCFNVVFTGESGTVDKIMIVHKNIAPKTCDNYRGSGWCEGDHVRRDPIGNICSLLLGNDILNKPMFVDFIKRMTIPKYEELRHRYNDPVMGYKLRDLYGECHDLYTSTVERAYADKLDTPPILDKLRGEYEGNMIKCDTAGITLAMFPGDYIYEIGWSTVADLKELIDWVHQLREKSWITSTQLVKFFELTRIYIKETDPKHFENMSEAFTELSQIVCGNILSYDAVSQLVDLCKKHKINQPWC